MKNCNPNWRCPKRVWMKRNRWGCSKKREWKTSKINWSSSTKRWTNKRWRLKTKCKTTTKKLKTYKSRSVSSSANLKTTIFLIFVGRKKSILFYLYFGVFCWWVFCFFLIKISELEKDIRESVCKERKLEHDCEELRSQVDLLKDEAASHIEHIHSLKDSNFKLTDGLEEAISKGEAFKSRWDFCSLKQLFFLSCRSINQVLV